MCFKKISQILQLRERDYSEMLVNLFLCKTYFYVRPDNGFLPRDLCSVSIHIKIEEGLKGG
jgi:hypothetical protein